MGYEVMVKVSVICADGVEATCSRRLEFPIPPQVGMTLLGLPAFDASDQTWGMEIEDLEIHFDTGEMVAWLKADHHEGTDVPSEETFAEDYGGWEIDITYRPKGAGKAGA